MLATRHLISVVQIHLDLFCLDHAHWGIMRGSRARVHRPNWLKTHKKRVCFAEPGLTDELVRGGFKPRVLLSVASPFRVGERERRVSASWFISLISVKARVFFSLRRFSVRPPSPAVFSSKSTLVSLLHLLDGNSPRTSFLQASSSWFSKWRRNTTWLLLKTHTRGWDQ